MSIMICANCEESVDTDSDLDGTWLPTQYICTACTEEADDLSAEVLDNHLEELFS